MNSRTCTTSSRRSWPSGVTCPRRTPWPTSRRWSSRRGTAQTSGLKEGFAWLLAGGQMRGALNLFYKGLMHLSINPTYCYGKIGNRAEAKRNCPFKKIECMQDVLNGCVSVMIVQWTSKCREKFRVPSIFPEPKCY